MFITNLWWYPLDSPLLKEDPSRNTWTELALAFRISTREQPTTRPPHGRGTIQSVQPNHPLTAILAPNLRSVRIQASLTNDHPTNGAI